jgi:hypothetical protein
VTGALSLALSMSAAFAPVVGRWADAGHVSRSIQNGELARAPQLARAVGPSLAAWIAASSSYAVVFVELGAGLTCLTFAWLIVPPRTATVSSRM